MNSASLSRVLWNPWMAYLCETLLLGKSWGFFQGHNVNPVGEEIVTESL